MATFPLSAILGGIPAASDEEDTLAATYIDDADPSMPVAEPRKPLDVSKGAPTGGNIDALKEAFAQARQNRLGAELGMAGETIQRAFAPKAQSTGYWQRMLQGADRPVQELQAQQKLDADATERALKRQDAGLDRDLKRQTLELNRLGREEQARRYEQEVAKIRAENELKARQNDPTSEESVAAQDAAAQTAYGKSLGPKLRSLSATQLLTGAGLLKTLREPDQSLGWARLAQAAEEGALNRLSREQIAALLTGFKQTERDEKKTDKKEAAEALLHVPGWNRKDAKGSIKEKEAEEFREATANYDIATGYLSEMGNIRTEKGWLGTKLPTEAKAEIGTFQEAMLGTLNQMYRFGALDAGSTAILKKMIPNENDFLDNSYQGKLKALQRALDIRIKARGRKLGYEIGEGDEPAPPTTTTPPAPPAATPTAPAASTGTVRLRFPDGAVKAVPAGRAEEFRKLGGVDA